MTMNRRTFFGASGAGLAAFALGLKPAEAEASMTSWEATRSSSGVIFYQVQKTYKQLSARQIQQLTSAVGRPYVGPEFKNDHALCYRVGWKRVFDSWGEQWYRVTCQYRTDLSLNRLDKADIGIRFVACKVKPKPDGVWAGKIAVFEET